MMTQYTNKIKKTKTTIRWFSLRTYWRLFLQRPKFMLTWIYLKMFFFKWLTCLTAFTISFDYISCLVSFSEIPARFRIIISCFCFYKNVFFFRLFANNWVNISQYTFSKYLCSPFHKKKNIICPHSVDQH